MQILIAAWIVFWSRWSFTACCDADWPNTERSRLALEKPKKIKAFDWQKTECQFRKPSLEKLLTEKTERQFRKPSLEKGETETGKNWVPIYKTVSGKAWDKPVDFHDLWRRRLLGWRSAEWEPASRFCLIKCCTIPLMAWKCTWINAMLC